MVNLIWATPNGDDLIARLARVSNPSNENNLETAPKLIRYMIKNQHWSPFEMASACFEITTTRDIARQILRHRSFSFQEFSQRYAEVEDKPIFKETRIQDPKNRQSSLVCGDQTKIAWWEEKQKTIWHSCLHAYRNALALGIAKEQARALLPEGLTPTRMYMTGTIRSWIHYLDLRTRMSTQKEHREIAIDIKWILKQHFPNTIGATGDTIESSTEQKATVSSGVN